MSGEDERHDEWPGGEAHIDVAALMRQLVGDKKRIAEIEAERDGLRVFNSKLTAEIRALQKRLAAAGLNANVPGKAERESA